MTINFAVSDTGIGIPKNKQQSIFDSFSQADSSTARKYGGTGLGLAISSNLVKKMGSQIQVESDYGKGSCFFFAINVPFEHCDKEPLKDFGWIKKVLVIDDNSTNRKIVDSMLSPLQIQTDQASSGIHALEILDHTEDYDVLIIDYHMPNMDGIQLM